MALIVGRNPNDEAPIISMNYPEHFEADSVQEAVALAERLQAADEYNIFRGQIVDWPMRSSFCRRAPAERTAAERKFLEFAAFVHGTPELEALRGDRFGVMAIAQHYGIPTFLVDFTTKATVAGWFASDGKPVEGRRSVIYLAHEEYLAEHYRDRLPLLKTLRIAVDNLWRLQAQSGLFLHLPYADDPELDTWLAEGFGSIRFRYRGPLGEIPESAIYPNRKSRLEVLFDGFTTEQKLRESQARLRALGMQIIPPPDAATPRPAAAFVGEQAPPVHPSWAASRTVAWSRPPAETFRRQDHPPEVLLEARSDALKDGNPRALQRQLAARIQEFMASHPNARAGFVNFRLCLSDSGTCLDHCAHPESRLRRTVGQDLADCWDGMRVFPYPDWLLCNALAYLATSWLKVHGAGLSLYQTTQALLGTNLFIEFGLAIGGQHATVAVPEEEFITALRSDLPDLLKPELHDRKTKPDLLLHEVLEPARLFDFERFVELFGYRLVPGQFLMRQREVVLFSPTGIDRLGNR